MDVIILSDYENDKVQLEIQPLQISKCSKHEEKDLKSI